MYAHPSLDRPTDGKTGPIARNVMRAIAGSPRYQDLELTQAMLAMTVRREGESTDAFIDRGFAMVAQACAAERADARVMNDCTRACTRANA
jgi:hypothetical protein